MTIRSVVLRVAALALLLLLAIVGALVMRTLQRLPDTVLYLVRSDPTGFTLEPVTRQLRPAGPLEAARAAVAALAAGPTAAKARLTAFLTPRRCSRTRARSSAGIAAVARRPMVPRVSAAVRRTPGSRSSSITRPSERVAGSARR
ncbi:MAG: hypothetical protein P1P87_13255, partial [Trueperaceae bacterium]|nr:hypothetical protein [Trueperaceae bacterium]